MRDFSETGALFAFAADYARVSKSQNAFSHWPQSKAESSPQRLHQALRSLTLSAQAAGGFGKGQEGSI
jgi:hypothetical protein